MLDIILLLLLGFAAWKGWRSGFVSMLLGLALLIIAGLVASAFATQFGSVLGITSSYLRPVVGFLAIFAIIVILGGRIRRFIRPKRGLLRGLDGLLGAALGLIRGAFMLSILLIVLRLVNLPSATARESSVLYPLVLKTSTTVINVLRPYARMPEQDATV